jgi:membrane-associated phospholipid phosphatase
MRWRPALDRWIVVAALAATVAGAHTPALAKHKPPDPDRPYWRTNLFKRVVFDQPYLVTRWFPEQFKDPLFDSTLGAGLFIAIQSGSRSAGTFDAGLENAIHKGASPFAINAAHVFTDLGEGVVGAALLGITYGAARHDHNDRLAEASSLAGEALLNAGIWVEVLKAASARVRPGNPDANRFFQYGAPDNASFPSGHAMGAFSVAAVFAGVYRDTTWVPWVSYGLATSIGLSRIVLGRHYPGDVLVGGVLGASIGRAVVARNGEENLRKKSSIVPVVGPGGRGVGIGWSLSWK